MGQELPFFDTGVLPIPSEPKVDNEYVGAAESDREKEILTMLADIEIATDRIFEKKKKVWERHERMMYGNQWEVDTRETTQYNEDGNPIYQIRLENKNDRDDMPRRTVNYIFPMLQTELALINELNPTIQVVSNNYDRREECHRKNLFLNHVFGTKVSQHYAKATLDAEIYDQGFLKIAIKEVEDGQIPFSCVSERAKNIKYDPLADTFEDCRWVIFTLYKYSKEVKQKYDGYKTGKKDFELIALKEFWVREGARWNQYVVCDQKLLKVVEGAKSYPVNIFEVMKLYFAAEGAGGVSEVALMMEDQIVINKRASQMEWHTSMLIDPPVEVYGKGLAAKEETKLPLKPGQYYVSQSPNIAAIKPITTSNVSTGEFLTGMQDALGHAELVTGVQRTAMGQNATGTYTGTHFQKQQDAVQTRIKNKTFFLKLALKNMGYKALTLAQEYLSGGLKFTLWDDSTMSYVDLTKEDFRDVSSDTVVVSTADAALLDPLTRIEKMLQVKQYTPNFPDDEFYRCLETVQPNFFDAGFMRRVNQRIQFTEKMTQLQMEAQIKQLTLQIDQMDMQIQQMEQQKAQAAAAAQAAAMQPPMPPALPEPPMAPPQIDTEAAVQPASYPSTVPPELSGGALEGSEDPTINWQEVLDASTQTLMEAKGIPQEQAHEIVVSLLASIEQSMPEATDMQKVAEYSKQIMPVIKG